MGVLTEATALIEVRDVVKSFGAVRALRGVSLGVAAGEVLGICGHNGAGKTTLMSVLVGSQQPDSGSILLRGEEIRFPSVQASQRNGIALVDQELSLVPTLTVAENLVLGNVGEPMLTRPKRLRERAVDLLSRVGLQHVRPDSLTGRLALGEQQLIEIARSLGRDAELLILDEPTASLSSAEIERVFDAVRAMAKEGKSVIFVSHRLDEVLEICDQVAVLRDGEVVGRATTDSLDKQALVELMLGRRGQELSEHPRVFKDAARVQVSNLSVPWRLRAVTFEAPGGAIVGLAGQVGSGASELLRALAGLMPGATGEVRLGGRPLDFRTPRRAFASGIHYLTNDRKAEGLFLSHPVLLNLAATRLRELTVHAWLSPRRIRACAGRLAQSAMLPADRLARPVATLSGGNQQKTLLGRCLEAKSLALLLLDEPTRGVDVGARAELHRLIRQIAAAGAAVIFSSTDLDEILTLSDLVATMFAGEIVSVRPRSHTSAARIFAEMTQTPPSVGGIDG